MVGWRVKHYKKYTYHWCFIIQTLVNIDLQWCFSYEHRSTCFDRHLEGKCQNKNFHRRFLEMSKQDLPMFPSVNVSNNEVYKFHRSPLNFNESKRFHRYLDTLVKLLMFVNEHWRKAWSVFNVWKTSVKVQSFHRCSLNIGGMFTDIS